MTEKFDVIVIGTGPAGSSVAISCAQEGLRTAVIDERAYGGTCPLRGCNPKKVLASAATMIDETARMQGKGIAKPATINWQDLMEFKRSFTEPVPEAKEKSFEKAGIERFHGQAQFLDEKTLKVKEKVLEGEKIVIATGARPAPLPVDGADHLTYSEDFLELDQLPKRVIFVGGGYISFEFAHIAARAGSDVHIVQRGEQPLKSFDSDMVDLLQKKSKEIGISIHLNSSVNAIEKNDKEYIVKASKGDEEVSFHGDLVVHGGGRVPQINDLKLDQGGVNHSKTGITVNTYLQSVSNEHVYAVGDVADTNGSPLTPVGEMEGKIVSQNIVSDAKQEANYNGIPSVVFSEPKLAKAGLTEKEAREANYDVKVNHQDISDWFTYSHTNDAPAAVKIIIDKKTDLILGAHLIGGKSDELINYFAMAIQMNIPVDKLKNVVYAFPTAVSDIPSML
ncbi:glutathione amide reductase [Oceanobacillus picturae]|uniref:Glutathione amide reductase n=1 Tax=Oceanobacillus picturae TaxID=171693 RepID=A0A0U9H738_9BACI|nr:NAD(P)/FAD-dependent oxidoreductase [Oceanobacillus picturae]GAQ17625.1 glutathione amide reductase [Oceanobacillus picturae]